eukprot:TRINITY_DN61541_c0_g1_i2.p1 TRINITY_DN61541_c0_g1~~TRINITY_DN61541_c0_g1_i2.p1  ORF type:complete len:162 (-),score=24.85 TRINITY_DN61541_c0_g1_i2:320-805(-)
MPKMCAHRRGSFGSVAIAVLACVIALLAVWSSSITTASHSPAFAAQVSADQFRTQGHHAVPNRRCLGHNRCVRPTSLRSKFTQAKLFGNSPEPPPPPKEQEGAPLPVVLGAIVVVAAIPLTFGTDLKALGLLFIVGNIISAYGYFIGREGVVKDFLNDQKK